MSLPQCGICGEAIGLSSRCVHQPAPVALTPPLIVADDNWIEDLLLDIVDDSTDLYSVDLTEEDLNVGIPLWILQDFDPSPVNQPGTNL